MKRAKKIVERYRDEREIGTQNPTQLGSQKKFNILWSNVQTLQPALFSKTPIPDIGRRYKDRDPVGLAAAAQRKAYAVVDGVVFDGMQCRRDIGFRAV